jgi:hypothetical protein
MPKSERAVLWIMVVALSVTNLLACPYVKSASNNIEPKQQYANVDQVQALRMYLADSTSAPDANGVERDGLRRWMHAVTQHLEVLEQHVRNGTKPGAPEHHNPPPPPPCWGFLC